MTERIDQAARLTIDQAASFLGIARRTVYEHAKRGLLKIEHDERGKPYITRGTMDGYLDAKQAGVRKTEFIPEGCVVIREDAWHQTRQIAEQMTVRVAGLEQERQRLLTYEALAAEERAERERLATEALRLEQERQQLAEEVERLRRRGWLDRLFNR